MFTEANRFSTAIVVLARRNTRTEGVAIAIFAVVCFGGFAWLFPQLAIGTVLIGAAILAFAGYLIWKDSRMELTIEDGCLCWVDQFKDTHGRVVIADIVAIRLENKDFGGEPGDHPDFFIETRDCRQFLLPLNVIPSCPRVIKAITALNPDVRVYEVQAT
jgi:hypothetical protein